jgi:PhnB protein
MKDVRMHFAPYIYFYGRCEEALDFYKAVFGGSYEAMRFAGTPMAAQTAPGFQDKIMHATFTAPGISFMASDGQPGKTIDPEAGNIALSVATSDVAEGTRIFNALAEGGNVSMPLEKQFWGATFGQLVDRFGNEWMLNIG